MRKKDYSNLIIFILLSILFLFILYPKLLIYEVEQALFLFIKNYFPAVFLIYIISDLLINYHFPEKLANHFGKYFTKFFHCDSNAFFVVLLSMISGFPSGAKYTKALLDQQKISLDTANYLITFTHFSNPLYILGTCFLFTKNRVLTIGILLAHFFSNFLIAFFTRPKEILRTNEKRKRLPSKSFSDALSSSIKHTFDLLFLILGTSIFFFTISGIIERIIHTPYTYLLTGLFELTKGISHLPSYLSPLGQGFSCLFFLSFGGISIHMQVCSIIKESGISYQNYFLGRIVQVALSIILFFLFSLLIPINL